MNTLTSSRVIDRSSTKFIRHSVLNRADGWHNVNLAMGSSASGGAEVD
jgi:hypothetical protein